MIVILGGNRMVTLCIIKTGSNWGISFVSSVYANKIDTTEDITKARGFRNVGSDSAIYAEDIIKEAVNSRPGYRYIWVDKPSKELTERLNKLSRQYNVIKSIANGLGIRIIPFMVKYDGHMKQLGITIINAYSNIVNECTIEENRVVSLDGQESIIFDTDGNIAYSSLNNWFKALKNIDHM